MIKNYFITALRSLWRNKFFALINVLGLSIGIACCMLIFLYAKDEITFDRFHINKDNIYRITAELTNSKGEISKEAYTGMMPGPEFKEQIPEIESFIRVESAYCTVKKDADVFDQKALWADDNFFSVFSFPLIYGNAKTALTELHSVVISEELAKKYFGKTNAVGMPIELNTDQKFETFIVTGVAKNSPQNSSININMVLPMKFHQTQSDDKEWMNFFLNTFVVLKPGADLNSVALKANHIFQTKAAPQLKLMKEKFDFNDKAKFGFQPFLDMHLSTDYPAQNGLSNASNPVYSYILTGIAAFILLIACINFTNLTVARSLKRAKEIGIRKVMGSERKQLITQFLGESYILCLFSFLLAILLALTALPFFNSLSNKALSFSYLFDLKLVAGYLVLFLVTGFMAGFYPALVLSKFTPVQTLYGKLRFSGKGYLSRALVVLQFTLATFLIITTFIVYSQFNFLLNYDLGYDKTNVLKVSTGNMNTTKLEAIKSELTSEPSINLVSAQQGGGYVTVAHINGDVKQEFGFSRIDEITFPLFKIPIIQGRNFSKDYPADSTHSLIVNEKFVKEAGWKEPIGQVIDFYYREKKYNVIGVVKDFHTGPLTEKITAQVFSIDPQLSYRVLFLKINPNGKTAALNHVEKTIKKMFPEIPYQFSFWEEDMSNQYNSEAKWKQIISFSALLTIFISCIGLFGLAALSAEKRIKEISIRKILGASVIVLVRNLSFDFLKLVTIASCIAVPATWWVMKNWLDNYPYHIEMKIYMFGFSVFGILIIALLTISYQAFRSAIANPVKNLKTE